MAFDWRNPSREHSKQILLRYANGEGSNSLANDYGCSPKEMCFAIRRAGGVIDSNRRGKNKRRIPEEVQQTIVANYLSGMTMMQTAAAAGLCWGTIHNILRDRKVQRRGHVVNCTGAARYLIHHDFFNEIDSPIKAYLLGLFATDGHIHKNRRSATLSFKAADREFLEQVRDIIAPGVPIREYMARPRFPRRQKQSDRKYPYVHLAMCSRQLAGDLIRHGIRPKKSATVRFWKGPAALMPHYVRGCIDGDGCIYLDGRNVWHIGFAGNRFMVDGMQAFLVKRANVRVSKRETNGILQSIDYGCITKCRPIAELLYSDPPIALTRKHDRAKIILTTTPRVEGGYKSWAHITKSHLLKLYRKHRNWQAVAVEIGAPLGTICHLKYKLGIPVASIRKQ